MSEVTLWGVSLSPYHLKLEACLQHHQIRYRKLPQSGGLLENSQFMLELEQAKRAKQVSSYPSFNRELDEYPSVPYIRIQDQQFYCDSTGIARWLDDHFDRSHTLYPEQALERFIALLIEEAFDEFGLYLVHHMRWVGSARTNEMGKILGQEFKPALPLGAHKYLETRFPKRQVRRCPYLFSVAPPGYRAGVKAALTPPSKPGFPETHTLLFTAWKRYVDAVEGILSQQPYVLGEHFSIADAAVYGQLGMNLVDREAADQLLKRAPKTYNWLYRIRDGRHALAHRDASTNARTLRLTAPLTELLNCIMGTFSALMVQNEKAYIQASASGEQCFNEAAFNQGKALYEGRLLGFPFKSVVKTFQVKVWRDLKHAWNALNEDEQACLKDILEAHELFES